MRFSSCYFHNLHVTRKEEVRISVIEGNPSSSHLTFILIYKSLKFLELISNFYSRSLQRFAIHIEMFSVFFFLKVSLHFKCFNFVIWMRCGNVALRLYPILNFCTCEFNAVFWFNFLNAIQILRCSLKATV